MMKRFMAAVVVAGLSVMIAPASARSAEPVPVIFDTDICGDCDDVLALAMLHSLESRGACRLLAVTTSAQHEQVAPFVDAVNTFFGRGSIPVGVVGEGGVAIESKFLRLAQVKDGEKLRYPHDLSTSKEAPAAVAVLRKALAGEQDGSVVIAQVGFSTNLARLLDSPGDAISELSGKDLVKRKVRVLSLMAGAFETIGDSKRFCEYNVARDVPSCQKLAKEWPGPMVWSGFEIGIALAYPHQSIERDYGYVEHHPVAEAYIARNPPPHDRPTWDLTSVLYGVYPDRGYFELSREGRVTVEEDGYTKFEATPDGPHRYLILKEGAKPRVLEALVQLSSQPPTEKTASDKP